MLLGQVLYFIWVNRLLLEAVYEVDEVLGKLQIIMGSKRQHNENERTFGLLVFWL